MKQQRSLTDVQTRVLDIVTAFLRDNGRGPTMGEIAERLGGVNRKPVIASYLTALKRHGCVEWNAGDYRTLRLLGPALRNAGNGNRSERASTIETLRRIRVRLVDEISAVDRAISAVLRSSE